MGFWTHVRFCFSLFRNLDRLGCTGCHLLLSVKLFCQCLLVTCLRYHPSLYYPWLAFVSVLTLELWSDQFLIDYLVIKACYYRGSIRPLCSFSSCFAEFSFSWRPPLVAIWARTCSLYRTKSTRPLDRLSAIWLRSSPHDKFADIKFFFFGWADVQRWMPSKSLRKFCNGTMSVM